MKDERENRKDERENRKDESYQVDLLFFIF